MMVRQRSRRFEALILFFLAAVPAYAGSLEGELSSPEAVDGSIVIVTARVAGATAAPKGRFGEVEFPLYAVPSRGPGVYEGILGVPFGQKAGDFAVTLRLGEEELRLPLRVKDGNYPSERLKVDPRKINPRKKDLVRIRREQARVRKVYEAITAEKLWQGPFALPIQSEITSIYGTKRVFNGEMQSFHAGLDLRAKVGTPVLAPAAGVVALTGDLFFTGKTVILDHGYGVMTVYAHLSRITAKQGQRVTPGARLGLSGATGRVSGPHLHWMAVVHKAKVDPLQLTKVMR
ncbi:MAG: M23 family metallopeptidase [Oligoflexia bacterium]|nr:M23 family metallopeptidase [Oligoflexia bacterium]